MSSRVDSTPAVSPATDEEMEAFMAELEMIAAAASDGSPRTAKVLARIRQEQERVKELEKGPPALLSDKRFLDLRAELAACREENSSLQWRKEYVVNSMCRDDHDLVLWLSDEFEQCPVCRARAATGER